MLKRIAAIAAAGVLAFAIAGCSSGTSSSAASSATVSSASAAASASAASSSAGSTLFSDLKWPENHVTEGVPVPAFSVAPDSVNESDRSVSATWKGVSDDEVLAYVEQIKSAGFTHSSTENKSSNTYSYSGQNNEKITASTAVIISYAAKSEQNDSQFSITVQRFAD